MDAEYAPPPKSHSRGLIGALLGLLVVTLVGLVGTILVVSATGGTGDDSGGDGAPRIGLDHWHASYTFYACGEKQPNAPTWEGVGVHTHGDGIIHIHPFSGAEEGAGSRLVKWFEYGAGVLDDDEIRLPGLNTTYKNGDTCGQGTPYAGEEGVVQVFVNAEELDDWEEYIPQDGDQIQMTFGPPDAVPILGNEMPIIDVLNGSLTQDLATTLAAGLGEQGLHSASIVPDEYSNNLIHPQTIIVDVSGSFPATVDLLQAILSLPDDRVVSPRDPAASPFLGTISDVVVMLGEDAYIACDGRVAVNSTGSTTPIRC